MRGHSSAAYLMGSTDGLVSGDDDIDVVRSASEQPQRSKVGLNRVCGVRSRNGIRMSESMSPATRTPRSSSRSAAGPGHWPDARCPDFGGHPRDLQLGRQTGN